MTVSNDEGKTNVIFPAGVKQSGRKWELQYAMCTHCPQFGHIHKWRKNFLIHFKDFEQSPNSNFVTCFYVLKQTMSASVWSW